MAKKFCGMGLSFSFQIKAIDFMRLAKTSNNSNFLKMVWIGKIIPRHFVENTLIDRHLVDPSSVKRDSPTTQLSAK
jgi:hypothetical protein